jgi:hypothetical protein
MDSDAELTYRAFTPEDMAFVHDSWARSYYSGTCAHRFLTPDEFHAYHRPIRERFFARPTATVIVCCNASDAWQIVAWIAVEQIPSGLVVQYIYVKDLFKGRGICRQLIKRAIPTHPVIFTHLTDKAAKIMAAKQTDLASWRHIPHLV